VLTALCDPAKVAGLLRAVRETSTTIRVGWTSYRRQCLPREIGSLSTTHRQIPFKVSRLAGRVVIVAAEFDEVRRITRDKRLPVGEVIDGARAEGRRLFEW
jgi:uncharacterized protein (DUF111 family)